MLRIDSNQLFVLASQLGTQRSLKQSMERLSTGLRINRASDDAAGLAVSEQMRTQVRGTAQANRNIQDGIAYLTIAEGTLNEVQGMMQHLRDLAVQAQNDTLTTTDRGFLQLEFSQLAKETRRIVAATNYNSVNIFQNNLVPTLTTPGAAGTNALNSVTITDIESAQLINPADTYTIERMPDVPVVRTATTTIQTKTMTWSSANLGAPTQYRIDGLDIPPNPLPDEWDGLPGETVVETHSALALSGVDFSPANSAAYTVTLVPEGDVLAAQAPLTYGLDYTFDGTNLILSAAQDPGGDQDFDLVVESRTLLLPADFFTYSQANARIIKNSDSSVLTAGVDYSISVATGKITINNAAAFRGGVTIEYLGGPSFSLDLNLWNGANEDSFLRVDQNGSLLTNAQFDFGATGLSLAGVPLVLGDQLNVSYMGYIDLPDVNANIDIPTMTMLDSQGNPIAAADYSMNGSIPRLYLKWSTSSVTLGPITNGETMSVSYMLKSFRYHITGGTAGDGYAVDTDFWPAAPNVLPGISFNLDITASPGDKTVVSFSSSNQMQIGPNATSAGSFDLFHQSVSYLLGNLDELSIDGSTIYSGPDDTVYNWQEQVTPFSTGNNGTVLSTDQQKSWKEYRFAMTSDITAIRVLNSSNLIIEPELKKYSDAAYPNTSIPASTFETSINPGESKIWYGSDLTGRLDPLGFRIYELYDNASPTAEDFRVFVSREPAAVFRSAARTDLNNVISEVDNMIEKISGARTDIGSTMNRLEHALANGASMEINTAAAESRIRDADMALEMTQFTRAQILQQASYSMLAQANSSSKMILQLLGVG